MRIIFFQNCVSPHQVPYMKVLAKKHEVTLIAPCVTTSDRVALGWADNTTEIGNIKLMIAPTDAQVKDLLEGLTQGSERVYCMFSGITAFKEVKHWLDMSLYYPVRRGIISEAPITYFWPLWVHKLKFLFCDLKYRKYVQYIFAIGETCAEYYRGWGSHWRVVDFAYCVEDVAVLAPKPQTTHKFRMCFVGSLTRRKNVMMVLKALVKLKSRHMDTIKAIDLTIVGDGPDRKKLERFVDNNNLEKTVRFVGSKPMDEARNIIAQNDVLILPSLYDGWGAVVNEALMVGTQVWCSSHCGAKDLIGEEGPLGLIFNPHNSQNLAQILWNSHGFFLEEQRKATRREKIKDWAKENISAEAIASIMEDTLNKK